MAYVMIIDDDEDFALSTAAVLESEGHEVKVELRPGSALASMKERTPELMIVDVMFPEDSSAGFALTRQIREQSEELKQVPILLLTGMNAKFPLGFGERDIDEEWLPVQAFLEKPVDHDVLAKRVAELLSQTAATKTHHD